MSEFVFDPAKHAGWAGPVAAKAAWDKIGHMFPQFVITGSGPDDSVGKRIAFYEIIRKVLGDDTPNYPQETGDCFLDGALVTLGDGTLCPIEDVGVGETVIAGTGSAREVVGTTARQYTGDIIRICTDGQAPTAPCTASHQYQLMDDSWVAAQDLAVGMSLKVSADYAVSNFTGSKITSIQHIAAKDVTVRCLNVADDHSFIANGYVVHNCVSFGAKNVIETLQCIANMLKQTSGFHAIFPPYLYNIGRVLVGEGQLRGSQGSLGSWQAKAVELYGSLTTDFPDCPKYSGKLANQWGDEKLDDKFYDAGKMHLVKTTAPIHSWDAARQAANNGYPMTIASNQGFEMKARSDGFHYPSGEWGHQMSFQIIDDDPKSSYAGILNNWGDVHGVIKDFKTGENWPKGMLRVRREVIEHMIKVGECIAYSNWEGFPAQKLAWASII